MGNHLYKEIVENDLCEVAGKGYFYNLYVPDKTIKLHFYRFSCKRYKKPKKLSQIYFSQALAIFIIKYFNVSSSINIEL